jgi:hypothetical protein
MDLQLALTLEKKPDQEFEHHFKGFGIHPSVCQVQIWKMGNKTFILFTDLGKGTSVTNASEQLVQEIYAEYLHPLPKEECMFAETYGDKEGIDLVLPVWRGDAVSDVEWKHLGVLTKHINSKL